MLPLWQGVCLVPMVGIWGEWAKRLEKIMLPPNANQLAPLVKMMADTVKNRALAPLALAGAGF